jgi:transcriptional regulator GlxA family with amidase domain
LKQRLAEGPDVIDRTAYVLVFDGFVEWQVALALASLRRIAGVRVIPVGFGPLAVVGLSGLRVIPETTFHTTTIDRDDLIVLPGGELWERCEVESISAFLCRGALFGAWIAALGTGVVPLAHARLFRDRDHTSDGGAEGPSWLEAFVPRYDGRDRHRRGPTVTDGRIVTAAGTATLAFVAAILRAYANLSASQIDAWRRIHAPALPEDAPDG